MNLLISVIIGLLAGTHTATWGMYKDAPYEGFTWRKYVRSIILSTTIAVVFAAVTEFDLRVAGNVLILYGMTYVIERAVNEVYKTFFKEEDQSKYTIPMQFSVGGKVVENRRIRWLVGAVYVLVISLCIFAVYQFQQLKLEWPGIWILLTIGSLGGWISAFGGAWKDAPIEGFETLKFFRSPLIALFYATIIATFTDNYVYIGMCGLGYTIGTTETYKTFFFPNKPRGKFAGKDIQFPEMLEKRKPFPFLFFGIWVIVISIAITAFLQPHHGLI